MYSFIGEKFIGELYAPFFEI